MCQVWPRSRLLRWVKPVSRRSGASSVADEHGIGISSAQNAAPTIVPLKRIRLNGTTSVMSSLDEIIKYIQHSLDIMTNYGSCCGRKINYKNANFCQFCGGRLEQGEPVNEKPSQKAKKTPTVLSRPDGTVRKTPLKRIAPRCEHTPRRGANRGHQCTRNFPHAGKHAYPLAAPLLDF